MNYIYVLECGDGSLYTGWTTDLEKRVKSHSTGKGAKYTRSHLPVKLIYYEEIENKSDALKREYEIKSMSREEKLILIKAKQDGNI